MKKNCQRITRNAKKGFRGMRRVSLASISLYLDRVVLRIPFQAMLRPLTVIKKTDSDGFFI
jgi:hypothetical protein